jgi:putative membrane protein insertion efficiency factor
MARFAARLLRLPKSVLVGAVHGYRLLLKPWIGNTCRFEPSCSAYALQALQQHGALRGSALTGWRLLRCQPWCQGGCDPVPHNPAAPLQGLFSRLLTRGAPPTPAAVPGEPQLNKNP